MKTIYLDKHERYGYAGVVYEKNKPLTLQDKKAKELLALGVFKEGKPAKPVKEEAPETATPEGETGSDGGAEAEV